MAIKTRLGSSSATFDQMIQRFGVVTVMNAKVYDVSELSDNFFETSTAYGIYAASKLMTPRCTLDTLKVANVTMDGPDKTVTGGQYSNPLIKYGKSARLEMQDALGNAEAVEALAGGLAEYSGVVGGTHVGLHMGEDFAGPKMIVGDSFFIDQATGEQVNVIVMFYQFLPDSLFNLTQDAEGDATVFDMNGDLLVTDILVGQGASDTPKKHGVFYSIIDPNFTDSTAAIVSLSSTGKITLASGYTGTLDGEAIVSGSTEVDEGKAYKLVVKDSSSATVINTVISR